ncbi:hypothetical protein VTO73DRAFT_7284 [Trametes versicolor]
MEGGPPDPLDLSIPLDPMTYVKLPEGSENYLSDLFHEEDGASEPEDVEMLRQWDGAESPNFTDDHPATSPLGSTQQSPTPPSKTEKRGAAYVGHQLAPPPSNQLAAREQAPSTSGNGEQENAALNPRKRQRTSSTPTEEADDTAPTGTGCTLPTLVRATEDDNVPHTPTPAANKAGTAKIANRTAPLPRTVRPQKATAPSTAKGKAIELQPAAATTKPAPKVKKTAQPPATLQDSIHAPSQQARARTHRVNAGGDQAEATAATAQFLQQAAQTHQTLVSAGYTARFQTYLPTGTALTTTTPVVQLVLLPLTGAPPQVQAEAPRAPKPSAPAAPPAWGGPIVSTSQAERAQTATHTHLPGAVQRAALAQISTHRPAEGTTAPWPGHGAALQLGTANNVVKGEAPHPYLLPQTTLMDDAAATTPVSDISEPIPEEQMEIDFPIHDQRWQQTLTFGTVAPSIALTGPAIPGMCINPASWTTAPPPTHPPAYVHPPTRVDELIASGVAVIREPSDGFPERHKRDPADALRDTPRSTIAIIRALPAGTYIFFEVNGQRDMSDKGYATELVEVVRETLIDISGTTCFTLVSPTSHDFPNPNRDFATLWAARDFEPMYRNRFCVQQAWPMPKATLFILDISNPDVPLESPGRYVLTVKGFPRADKKEIRKTILSTLKSPKLLRATAEKIAEDAATPPNTNAEAVAITLLNSIKIETRKVMDNGQSINVAAIYCDPPTTDSAAWTDWVDRIRETPFVGEKHPPLGALAPQRCSGCHAGDHILVDCPYIAIPGWYGWPAVTANPTKKPSAKMIQARMNTENAVSASGAAGGGHRTATLTAPAYGENGQRLQTMNSHSEAATGGERNARVHQDYRPATHTQDVAPGRADNRDYAMNAPNDYGGAGRDPGNPQRNFGQAATTSQAPTTRDYGPPPSYNYHGPPEYGSRAPSVPDWDPPHQTQDRWAPSRDSYEDNRGEDRGGQNYEPRDYYHGNNQPHHSRGGGGGPSNRGGTRDRYEGGNGGGNGGGGYGGGGNGGGNSGNYYNGENGGGGGGGGGKRRNRSQGYAQNHPQRDRR